MTVTVTRTAVSVTETTEAPSDSAADLLDALAAMPAGHPSRAVLRDRAIEAWLPLARHLAHRYSGRGEPTDDLVQTATVGLIKAVDKFDPDRGVDFAGYAIPTIIGEIKRHFRDRTWSVRVPRRLQELRLAITEANSTLTHSLGRSPTVADIAAHLGVTEEDVLEGLEGARAYNATSLQPLAGAICLSGVLQSLRQTLLYSLAVHLRTECAESVERAV
jgi:RNA polymerase sigma-B factor